MTRSNPDTPRAAWVALGIVIVAGLLVTGLTTRLLADIERQRQQASLAGTAEQAAGVARWRFTRHEVQLSAARALFASSIYVSREDWRAFTRVFLDTGLLEMAWVPRVSPEELEQLVDEAHADGIERFSVYPPLDRDFYCPIFYNEPQELHAESLGRDTCVSDNVYLAMQRARDEGGIELSEPVDLGPSGAELQPGYVLFAWVERDQAQVPGWVAGTVTMAELFDVTLPGESPPALTVIDRSAAAGSDTVFRSGAVPATSDDAIEAERQLTLGGRDLRLRLNLATSPGLVVWLIPGTGTTITLLLAAFLFTLIRTRTRALRAAEQMTRAYRDSEELLSSITENIQEGIYRGKPGDGLIYVNKALANMFGFESPEAMMGQSGITLYAKPGERQRLHGLLDREGYYRNQEVTFVRRDGTRFIAVNSAAATRDERGRIRHFDGVVTDITERKQAEEEVHRLAHYDTLTNLPNRTLLHRRIHQILSQSRRHGRSVAVMFFDLDRFKLINDSLGHSIGDRLLIAVAGRLSEQFRDYDVISRQGGDEFLLVLPETEADQAAHRAEELLRDFAATPFHVEGHELTVTPSIGIAMFPDDAEDADSLIRHADAAMYHAKEQGRATFQFFTEELNARVHQRLTMENHLRGALAREELTLHFQPVVNLDDGQVVGTEALLRWRSPALGNVPPSQFIPVAEQSGLIVDIGYWVIDMACRQLSQWQAQGLQDLSVAVNVSAVQLWRGNLIAATEEALSRWKIEPSSLVVELTESVIMQDVETVRSVLSELKRLGVRLAIDDFGTGYSSLGYLKQFRIDLLKIDRSFVTDIPGDQDDSAIVAAVLSIAHDLRMQVIAEGIENRQQLEYLRARGCRSGQGFLFSPPVPPGEIPEIVAAAQPGWVGQ